MKIYCPKCGRVLGDCAQDFAGTLNCKNCKRVKVRVERACSKSIDT